MIFQYDARQQKCPLPLVNLRLLLKKMQGDDTCIIQVSDKGSIDDIPNLLAKLGYPYQLKVIDNQIIEIVIANKT